MNTIGFSARKQGGKSTAALHCCAQYMFENKGKLAVEINFADALKHLVCEFFLHPTETATGSYSASSNLSLPEYKKKRHPCGLTYRQIMQQVGTDLLRGLWPDIWVANYRDAVEFWEHDDGDEDVPDLVITADVRFPNEVKAIQDMGGKVVRLLRAPFPDDEHKSETALNNMQFLTQEQKASPKGTYWEAAKPMLFDAIIDNREMTIEQQNEATWKLVTERGWLEDSLADTEAYLKMQEKP